MKTIYITILILFCATLSFAQNTVNYQYDNEGRIIHSDDGIKVQIYQYDNLGNRTNYTINSNVTSTIDLTVNSISIPNTTVAQGQSYTVSCTAQNLGSTTVGTTILKVYLSPTATGTQTLLTTYNVPSINANSSENLSFNISIPSTANLGSQYLVFFIDANTSITETDETNNKDNIVVTVTVPNLAELNLQNASLSANNVQAGNSIDLTATVHNEGTVTANNFTVKSYLSNNATFEANDILLSNTTENITSLTANNNVAYSKTALIPSNTIAGNYYVLFVVDEDDTVAEANETNNISAVSVIVTNTSIAPIADFIANSTTVVVDGTVQFIDQSTNNPTSWLWTFEGGTPSTSTLQNPQIIYDTMGTYDVTLVATNANGSSTEIKSGYITVGDCVSDWHNVGIDGFTQGGTSKMRFEFDNSNTPYVLFRDIDFSNKTTVMKYVNGAWELVGNAGFSHVAVYDIELAFDNNDVPYVGYIDAVGSEHKISVKKFNGTSWVNVGMLNFSGRTDYTFDLAIDNNGFPAVIYEDGSYGGTSNWYWELMVKKFNGTSWVYATSTQLERGGYVDIEYSSNNELYAAYSLDDTNSYARVKKLVGSSWVTVGDLNISQDDAESINLEFDSNDIPYVAYSDGAYSDKTTVKKLNGTNWVTIGANGFSPDDFTIYQKLRISSDNIPYVSFRYYSPSTGSANRTAVMKFSNNSWVNVGNTDFTNSPAYGQILALNNDDVPYLAYWDGSNSSKVTVMKFACNESIDTDFIANQTTSTTGSVITFTDISTNSPTSWSWSFSPSTVTYVNGTSSISQNPEVVFDSEGLYSVTLMASNTSSSDTEVKTDYVSITQPVALTYVPDDNFENYLETHTTNGVVVAIGDANSMGNGVANDDYVITARINTHTLLNVSNLNISYLIGIEDFTSLIGLLCYNNQLSSLDVTRNTALTELDCSNNQLSSLDVTQNNALTYLSCYNNQLSSLDVTQNNALFRLYCNNNQLSSLDVTQNNALFSLDCYNNQLSSLDVTQNDTLNYLYCYNNQLSSLDVTQNDTLNYLSCYNNQLSSLDVTQNNTLKYLSCYNNQLSSLDVTQNNALYYLNCKSNQLSSLDVTQNNALLLLYCHNNQLTSLNVKNGNNTNIPNNQFKATNNPNLTCIFVDDVAYSQANWSNIDNNSTFVETEAECTALSVEEELLNQNIRIYPNPTNDILNIETSKNVVIERMKVYDITGKLLNTYKGNSQSISLGDYATGVYFINIQTEKGTLVKKIMKK